ncbi:hypothetical protein K458DRAFT_27786 [Lentithecium fluviatile CBS 122367]|uniref:Uncharacterized protein n=1 Tax=Lentithecium fluviatile CBS 122367 TaxID=1168545 RepID=A0A6G1J3R5_9PLEO|nr:hypothetical protein K458DRAFT_27786 [Lentithecium fluviatile CBS 122367]
MCITPVEIFIGNLPPRNHGSRSPNRTTTRESPRLLISISRHQARARAPSPLLLLLCMFHARPVWPPAATSGVVMRFAFGMYRRRVQWSMAIQLLPDGVVAEISGLACLMRRCACMGRARKQLAHFIHTYLSIGTSLSFRALIFACSVECQVFRHHLVFLFNP